jgi:hypothetical protein
VPSTSLGVRSAPVVAQRDEGTISRFVRQLSKVLPKITTFGDLLSPPKP